ncbi:hypothetical protein DL96DRAFT_1821003 [Flagelloscypha sp. PMI_526]|nr:hypothetical protein DL96DRAFT_1821003 [Flagelloscypha sp. PMI_526]
MASMCRMTTSTSGRVLSWAISHATPCCKKPRLGLSHSQRHYSATAFVSSTSPQGQPLSSSSLEAQLEADVANDVSRGPKHRGIRPVRRQDQPPAGEPVDDQISSQHAQLFSTHLDTLFPPLSFPPDLTTRILTHSSHPAAYSGHNGQLAFVGRRVLQSYLLLFLSSSPQLREEHDLDHIVSRALDARVLGEVLGVQRWGLAVAMRWTPSVPKALVDTARAKGGKSAVQSLLAQRGLYRVSGDAVEAVMGGIWKQFHTGRSTSTSCHTSKITFPTCFHDDIAAVRLDTETSGLVLGTSEEQTVPPIAQPSRTKWPSVETPTEETSSARLTTVKTTPYVLSSSVSSPLSQKAKVLHA